MNKDYIMKIINIMKKKLLVLLNKSAFIGNSSNTFLFMQEGQKIIYNSQ